MNNRYYASRSMFTYFIRPLLVGLLITVCFLTVWLRSSITSVEYRIGELEEQKMQAMTESKTLVAKRAESLAIDSVEEVAVKKIGLDFPERKRLYTVEETEESGTYGVSYRVRH